ncbi:MAG: dihydrofolate reductase [Planctomycetota bacterium]
MRFNTRTSKSTTTSTPRSLSLKSQSNFDLVVAMDRNRGIARDGDMPWHLPGDLKYFAKLTVGKGDNVVIMGRKTWDTIPQRYRPLPRRRNIVISRQEGLQIAGAECATSLDLALAMASSALGSVYVIGGAQIYALSLTHPSCHDVFVTEIDHDFGCQVFFPPLQGFARAEILAAEEENGLAYRFTRWSRQV